jgi:hypothetical protein
MQRKVFIVLNLAVLLFRNNFFNPGHVISSLPSLSLSVNHRVCAYAPYERRDASQFLLKLVRFLPIDPFSRVGPLPPAKIVR